jgi:hypothetical protein
VITTLKARFRAAPRTSQVLVVLIGLHVLLKALLLTQIGRVAVCCDQISYVDGGKALSNLVRDLVSLGPVHTEELQRNLVGGGWFTPGSSIMLAPLYVVDPHASTFAVRLYLGLFSTLLLLFAVSRVRRTLGDLYAIVLMVVPGLVPMWLLFSFSAWGDLVAGLLATILLMELISLMRTLVAGEAPTWRAGVRFGVAAIATVYARSSTSLLVLGMGVVLGLTALLVLRGRIRWRAVVSLAVAGVSFLAILAPWSVFASTTLKSRVVTTTTVPIVLANTFGNRDRVCFGPCDPVQDPGSTLGNIWFPPMQYSREVARATGKSEVLVSKQMWTYTRPSITVHSYTHDVIGDFWRYAGVPASFARLLLPPGHDDGVLGWLIYVTTYLGWGALFLAALALLLTVVRRSTDHAVISLITTLSIGTLFTQPFVHVGTGRYWTTAAPLGAIALGLLISTADARRRHPRFTAAPVTLGVPDPVAAEDGSGVRPESVRRWLTVAQAVLAVATALVLVLVPVLGA